jgi:hypothetical protein
MHTPTLESLAARLAAQEARLASLERANQELAQARRQAERRARWWRTAAFAGIAAGLFTGLPQMGKAQGTLDQRVAVLEGKLARVFVVNGGNDLVISGANLNIVNGLGDTQTANGLGNLIVGYNEARGGGQDSRGGSHNLVLGQRSNYKSFGGLIGGFRNEIAAPFCVVLTGSDCFAENWYGSVQGGFANEASGVYSCVGGGYVNEANGTNSTVSGGFAHTVTGQYDWQAGSLFQTQ